MSNKSVKYKRIPTAQNHDLDLIEIENSESRDCDTNKQLSELNTVFKESTSCNFYRLKFPCLILIIVLLIILTILFGYAREKQSEKNSFRNLSTTSSEWTYKLNLYESDSSIKLIDIDEDGLDDIIFGVTVINKTKSYVKYSGRILALRGLDGTILYNISTKSQVLYFNCHSIDIDLDKKFDCIGTGQNSTFLAFNPRTGKIFWDSSFHHELNDFYDIYNPLVIPYDFNKDGVLEIIISHGGNPNLVLENHDVEPSLVMLYSGRNGTLMGECLTLPDTKETHMSPALHTLKNGASYLLLGTGSESVPGSFYIISLPDFYKHVMSDFLVYDGKKLPDFRGEYTLQSKLKSNFKSINYIPLMYSIYSSKFKGLMVAPVLVDTNGDKTNDILIITFDGDVVLFDGESLEIIWKKYFECYESYSVPAPGYFNDDNILDFIIILNQGQSSKTLVLNGKDGSILYGFNSYGSPQVGSPLTIQTVNNHDLFYSRFQGIRSKKVKRHDLKSKQGPHFVNITNLKCENIDNMSSNTSIECNEKEFSFGLIIDRTAIDTSPLVVFKSESIFELNKEQMECFINKK